MSSSGRTPLERAPRRIAGERRVWLKREDVHELGSFKWRGALPAIEHYRALGAAGVVTASTGNHGAATAWAARRAGIPATIYAPVGASREKLARIESFGGEVRLVGRDLDEAKEAAREDAGRRGLRFFEDGAEPAQYGGYAALGGEILDELASAASLVVPVGNGALIGGIGEHLAARSAPVELVGVVARGAPVMALSYREGRAVACDRMRTFADGLAVRLAIPSAVRRMVDRVDRVETVSDREIAVAVGLYAGAGIRAEGAAAAALAAMLRLEDLPEPIVVVVTGRNIDEELYRRAVDDPESFPA